METPERVYRITSLKDNIFHISSRYKSINFQEKLIRFANSFTDLTLFHSDGSRLIDELRTNLVRVDKVSNRVTITRNRLCVLVVIGLQLVINLFILEIVMVGSFVM